MSVAAAGEMTIDEAWDLIKITVFTAWSKTTRRMRVSGAIILIMYVTRFLPESLHHALTNARILTILITTPNIPSTSDLPKLKLNYGPPPSPYNISKVALLVENRANPILPPLILHFMAVVPPDWRFRFMGSVDSVSLVNSSRAIRSQVAAGKLDLTYIPANMSTGSQEEISRFLTTLWLYEVVLQPAEWLLVFQTDSILCANSRQSLNNWLDYDWVGAPWNPTSKFGGNGGLSLRRVSAIIEVLRNQVRDPGSAPEDVWLTERLGHRPGSKLANGTASLTFSGEAWSGKTENFKPGRKSGKGKGKGKEKEGELVKGIDEWREGFYEPMGYHTGGSGNNLHSGIWGTPQKRKHLWDYCPEVKMTLRMDAAAYVPGNCGANWKRGEEMGGLEGELIDGVEYPMLPEGLVPW
ncbi:hypothetical protein B7494_g3393 [Chlorociboria aeruginascens]|nr:hypothetical protein B7494_g3393 [Chlorociboria aeruginascens]